MGLMNFFGRDTRFFDLLENSAVEARNCADCLTKLLAAVGSAPVDTLLGDLAQTRRKHKRVTMDISEALTKVFMTPIDREDIGAISSSLYRISKTIEKVGERLTICPPGTKLETLTKEFGAIEHACNVVQTLVGALRSGASLDHIRDPYERVQALEGDADKLLLEHLRELYRTDQDARLLVYWKDLYDLLEKVTDHCRDVGNEVFNVCLKNS
jgi:uncharacterized protein Yka (UPF0111/DUF47 family)